MLYIATKLEESIPSRRNLRPIPGEKPVASEWAMEKRITPESAA